MIQFNSPATLITIAVAIIVIMLVFWRMTKSKGRGKSLNNPPLSDNEQIYVGNLSYRIREGQLRDHFSQYGDVRELRIIKNHHNGRSKGFGFVTFEHCDSAQIALKSNGETFFGRPLVVRIAKPRS